jgi:hypothetical protein
MRVSDARRFNTVSVEKACAWTPAFAGAEREWRTRRKGRWVWLAALALAACDAGAGAQSRAQIQTADDARATGASLFAAAPDRRWRLPDRLNEISGLAVTREGRLLAHGDEQAIVYELDNENGRLVRNFALGNPVIRDDFEGIAATDAGDVYLITSAGRLYRFREGRDGERVAYEVFDTGLARTCEIEGLAFMRTIASLIVACKTNYASGMKDALLLYAWSLRSRRLADGPWRTLPDGAAARAAGAPDFHASSVDIDPRSGRVIVLAARERALVELDIGGAIAAGRRLDRSHRQAEGAAVMPDGALVIADEAAGARALLTRYPRIR